MNGPAVERLTVFRADAVRRHLDRAAQSAEVNLDPPRWLALLWVVAIAFVGLAAIVLH